MHTLVSATQRDAVLRKQKSLYRAAQSMSDGERFKRLFDLLKWEPWLQVAAVHVLSNKGANTPGVDGVAKKKFQANLEAELASLIGEIKAGAYHPKPVKRIYIPKPGSKKQRPLGIPTLRDRVMQKAVQMILDPIYEPAFEDCSYGFRPNRCCMDAIFDVTVMGRHNIGYEWVIEGDIRDCFGTIDHKILMSTLKERICDQKLLTILHRMLKAGVLEDLQYSATEIGTPQGGIVSPLLANIYLDRFDRWFANQYHRFSEKQRYRRLQKGLPNCRLIRYADDWVVMVKGTEEQAQTIRKEIGSFIASDLKMELSLEKTLITHISQGFDFLGCHFRMADRPKDGGKGLYVFPNKKAVQAYKQKIRELTQRNLKGATTLTETIIRINWVVIGWGNYFRYVNSKRTYSYLALWTWRRLFQYICKLHPKTGRKKVYQKYQVHSSKSRKKAHHVRNFSTLGVPLEKDWLLLENMAHIHIQRYRKPIRHILPPYDDGYSEPPESVKYLESLRLEVPRSSDPEWSIARLEALHRKGEVCTDCGSTTNLEVHHEVRQKDWPKGKPGLHDLENLVVLCSQCHDKRHMRRKS